MFANALDALGEIPLPPYIERKNPADLADDKVRYQTVYAAPPGSVAAPTAGLHFTEALLAEIRALGVEICFVTLHVGLGTFAPVKAESLSGHTMHEERYEVGLETAQLINEAKAAGRRVIAVGTTTVRVLESRRRAKSTDASFPAMAAPAFLFIPRCIFKSWMPCSPISICPAPRCSCSSAPSPRPAKPLAANSFSPPTPKPFANATASSVTAMPCC